MPPPHGSFLFLMRRLLLVILCTLAGTSSGAAADRLADGDRVLAVRQLFRQHCLHCHATADPDRGNLSLRDTMGLTSAKRRQQLVAWVEAGAMPPGIRPKLSQQDVQRLQAWADQTEPFFPDRYDDAYVLQFIADDLDELQQLDPEQLRQTRYVSLHRPIDQKGVLLSEQREQLRQVLAQFSPRPITQLTPVDPAAVIFRLDIGPDGLDWNQPLLQRVEETGSVEQAPDTLGFYDLLLLEYPYGFWNDQVQGIVDRLDQPIRPFAFLRGDWLIDYLNQPEVQQELAWYQGKLATPPRPLGPDQTSVWPSDQPASGIQAFSIPPLDAVHTRLEPAPAKLAIRLDLVSDPKDPEALNLVMQRGEETVHFQVYRRRSDGRVERLDQGQKPERRRDEGRLTAKRHSSVQQRVPVAMKPSLEEELIFITGEAKLPPGYRYRPTRDDTKLERLVHYSRRAPELAGPFCKQTRPIILSRPDPTP